MRISQMTTIALLALAASITLRAQSNIQQRFIGAWELVSIETRAPSGQATQPFGPEPVGRITYDTAGRMSVQLMRRGMPRFANEQLEKATTEEIVAAWRGYGGYFGTYTIDEKASTITHHVEGASFPNYVGTNQVRHYRFEGDRLILQADTASGRGTIVWKRSK
jgi:hypothetical protein